MRERERERDLWDQGSREKWEPKVGWYRSRKWQSFWAISWWKSWSWRALKRRSSSSVCRIPWCFLMSLPSLSLSLSLNFWILNFVSLSLSIISREQGYAYIKFEFFLLLYFVFVLVILHIFIFVPTFTYFTFLNSMHCIYVYLKSAFGMNLMVGLN